jgi:hypothetical protein
MNSEEFAGMDFGIGVVRGARSFRVDDDGWLTGIVYKQRWTVGENLAQCRKRETFIPAINPPDTRYQIFTDTMLTCRHGFYGYYDGSNDFRTSPTYPSAVIEGYGETVIGTRGFRCMKARIVALQTGDERAFEAITTNYTDIPLFVTFAQMLRAYPPDISERKNA